MENYRKPLTPLQIPSPSQFLLTTATTPTTNTIPITTTIPITQTYQQRLEQLVQEPQPQYSTASTIEPASESRRLSNEEHQEYRNIINDLTNELVDLTSQVSLAQNQIDNNNTTIPFEKTLHQLEAQNDLLQKTIETLEKQNFENETKIAQKEAKEQEQKYQIASIESSLEENQSKFSEMHVRFTALSEAVRIYKTCCKCGAVKQLDLPMDAAGERQTEELSNLIELLDQKTAELQYQQDYASVEKTRLTKQILDLEETNKRLQVRVSVLETTAEKKHRELHEVKSKLEGAGGMDENKYKESIERLYRELTMEKKLHKEQIHKLESELQNLKVHMDEQRRSLLKQTEVVVQLEKQVAQYRKQNECAKKEVLLLQSEIYSLKENSAASEGTERSLKEQLAKIQEELVCARCDVQRMNILNEDLDNYKKTISQIKDGNKKLIKQYNDLIEDYNKLHEEYGRLTEFNENMESELDFTRKWQDQQLKADAMFEQKIEKMTDHIRLLTEDREKLIDTCNELYRDAFLINSELDKYKDSYKDSLSASNHPNYTVDGVPVDQTSEQILNKIQRTATKLYHTRRIWEEQRDERRSSE